MDVRTLELRFLDLILNGWEVFTYLKWSILILPRNYLLFLKKCMPLYTIHSMFATEYNPLHICNGIIVNIQKRKCALLHNNNKRPLEPSELMELKKTWWKISWGPNLRCHWESCFRLPTKGRAESIIILAWSKLNCYFITWPMSYAVWGFYKTTFENPIS